VHGIGLKCWIIYMFSFKESGYVHRKIVIIKDKVLPRTGHEAPEGE
jgi:hypothetical protein